MNMILENGLYMFILKQNKINSEKLRSKDKIIKWENLIKEYENKIQKRVTKE